MHICNISQTYFFLPRIEKIKKCINSDGIEAEYINQFSDCPNTKNVTYKFHKIYKVVYIFAWIAIIIYLSIVLFLNGWACSDIYHIHFKNINYIAVYNLLLFIISMILNMGSYFMSIAHLVFSQRISEITNLAEWEYNRIMPSMTYGFRLLVGKMKDGAAVFTALAFMYTITYELILMLRENNDLAVDEYIQFASGIIFLLGIGTAICTVIIPYFMVKKMYNIWKEKELQSYDEVFKNNRMNSIRVIFEYKCLVEDRIRYDMNTGITIALSAATLCLNILSLDI